MANLIVALFAVIIILAAMAGYATSSVSSQDKITSSVKAVRDKTGEISRTGFATNLVTLNSGTQLDFTINNTGQSELRQISDWDVIVWYEGAGSGLQIARLTYTTSATPSAGEWTVTNIYSDFNNTNPEIYQPGIVNPGEKFVIRAELSPAVASSSSNTVTLAVEQGVTLTAVFTN